MVGEREVNCFGYVVVGADFFGGSGGLGDGLFCGLAGFGDDKSEIFK